MNKCSALPRWLSAGLGFLGIVIMCIAVSSPFVGAQQTDKATDKAKVDSAKQDEGIGELPVSPIEKAQKDGTALPITLKDVTKLALQNNIDIAISDTNEQTSQLKLQQTYGSYDPKLSSTASLSGRNSANTLSYDKSASQYNTTKTQNWDFTFTQPLKTGGSLSAYWSSSRSDSNSLSNLYNPSYGSGGSISINQPLWRNFRTDSTRTNIKLTNLDIKNSESQFKQKVSDTIYNIQNAYWTLVSNIQNYNIGRNSVRLARISLRDNKKKVEVGTSAPIDVTDAEAVVAQREVDLISSEEAILSAENSLRQLVSSDRKNEIWNQVIVPLDKPDFTEYKVDMNTAMNTALVNRPEMEQSDISLKRLDINKRLILNNRKWQVDSKFQYGSNGTGVNPEKGFLGAYHSLLDDGYTTWTLSFNVQIPLRNRDSDSQIAQAKISKDQELMRRKQTEQTIQVDVSNGIQQLETRRRQVLTAGVAKRLAQERLDGEIKRLDAGLSQNYLVLDRQQSFSQAELAELNALINYKKAIANMQKALYILVEASDFTTAKGNTSNVPAIR